MVPLVFGEQAETGKEMTSLGTLKFDAFSHFFHQSNTKSSMFLHLLKAGIKFAYYIWF
jgi:hypothetical protein